MQLDRRNLHVTKSWPAQKGYPVRTFYNRSSPCIWAQVLRVPREQPMVPIEVLGRILEFSISSFVWLLLNFRARRLGSLKVSLHILNKNRQALRSIAKFRRAPATCPRLPKHDPCIPQMHLRPADRLAITVMLAESECSAQPGNGAGQVLIRNVRQYRIRRHRTILDHACVTSR